MTRPLVEGVKLLPQHLEQRIAELEDLQAGLQDRVAQLEVLLKRLERLERLGS